MRNGVFCLKYIVGKKWGFNPFFTSVYQSGNSLNSAYENYIYSDSDRATLADFSTHRK